MSFRPDIEGLRGVAILLVIGFHLGLEWMRGGYVGVDVFFVLSGFLITGLLTHDIATSGRVRFLAFYARRVRRLLPVATVVLFATWVLSLDVYPPLEQRTVATAATAAALYASNILFALKATVYGARDVDPNPLLHTWSLGVEEQFYLLWPILLHLAGRRARSVDGLRARVTLTCALLGAASLALAVTLVTTSRSWAFFSSPTRGWEFAVGGLAAMLAPRARALPAGAMRLLGWIGLALVLLASHAFDQTTRVPGLVSLVPVVGTAALLLAGERADALGVGTVLTSSFLRWIGRLSYGWYLWHWPLLVLAQATLGPLSIAQRLLCMLLSLGLAQVTLLLVENPVRFDPRLARGPARTLALAALTTVTLGGVAAWQRGEALRRQQAPDQVMFAQARADVPAIYRDGCHLGFEIERRSCVFGDRSSDTTIVLFGDSHAAQWFPPLERVARRRSWRLQSITRSGCPAVSVRLLNHDFEERCLRWRDASLAHIIRTHPTVVVLGSYDGFIDFGDGAGDPGVTPDLWRAGTRATLATMSGSGLSVLLLRDSPRPGFDAPNCLARAVRAIHSNASRCTFPRTTAHREIAARLDHEALAGLRGISLLDLTDEICATPRCDVVRDGVILFTDTHHLTAHFTQTLDRTFERAIDRILQDRRAAGGATPRRW